MTYIVVIAEFAQTAKRFAKRTDDPVDLGPADPSRYALGKRRWGFPKEPAKAPEAGAVPLAILAKIRKLLALAEDSAATEGEASNAAAAAQRLIEQHQLSAALLDTQDNEAPLHEEPVRGDADPIDASKRMVRWRGVLAGGIARANGCRHYWHTTLNGVQLRVIGTPSRVTAVRYLYAYLSHEIDRLGAAAALGRGRSYGHAYRVGCASRVTERLREAAKQGREEAKAQLLGAGVALTRVENALAHIESEGARSSAWMKKHLTLRNVPLPKMRNASGFKDGQEAGNKIKLDGHSALGAGPRKRVRGGS